MVEKIVRFTDYDKNLYHFTLCGDLLVFGLSIIDCIGQKEATLDQDLVKNALVFLIKRHPLLRAHLQIDDENVFFKITEEAENYIINEDDLKWQLLDSRNDLAIKLENFNNQRFDYKSKCKLWRACVYEFQEENRKKYAIAFLLPLFMTDALNITSISIEIVNIINSLLLNTKCVEMSNKLDLIDNMYTIIDRNNLIKEKQLKKIDEINNSKSSSFKFASIFKSNNETGSKINILKLSKDASKNLISIAKSKNIKLTGFLMGCLFYSIRDLYKENDLAEPINVKFGVSTNLRFRFKPNLDFSSLGYYSTLISINTQYPRFGKYQDLMEDAKYLDGLIAENASVESGSIFSNSHNFKEIDHLKNLFKSNSDLKRVCSILNEESTWDVIVSNIGNYLGNKKEQCPANPFKIQEIYFSDSLNSDPPVDAAMLLHITHWNDQLMFMVSSNKSAIASSHIDRLLDLFQKRLNLLSITKFY